MDDATLTELGAALRADFEDWQRQSAGWIELAGAWQPGAPPDELARLEELALGLAGQADELAALHGWLNRGWPGAPPADEPPPAVFRTNSHAQACCTRCCRCARLDLPLAGRFRTAPAA